MSVSANLVDALDQFIQDAIRTKFVIMENRITELEAVVDKLEAADPPELEIDLAMEDEIEDICERVLRRASFTVEYDG